MCYITKHKPLFWLEIHKYCYFEVIFYLKNIFKSGSVDPRSDCVFLAVRSVPTLFEDGPLVALSSLKVEIISDLNT